MTYEKLMELVLQGKSVNARSKELGLGQRTLDRYVKAENLPDCDVVIIFAEATGLSIEQVVRIVAAKKTELRPERARSFLRPAMAAVLMAVIAVTSLIAPPPSYASDGFKNDPLRQTKKRRKFSIRKALVTVARLLVKATARPPAC